MPHEARLFAFIMQQRRLGTTAATGAANRPRRYPPRHGHSQQATGRATPRKRPPAQQTLEVPAELHRATAAGMALNGSAPRLICSMIRGAPIIQSVEQPGT